MDVISRTPYASFDVMNLKESENKTVSTLREQIQADTAKEINEVVVTKLHTYYEKEMKDLREKIVSIDKNDRKEYKELIATIDTEWNEKVVKLKTDQKILDKEVFAKGEAMKAFQAMATGPSQLLLNQNTSEEEVKKAHPAVAKIESHLDDHGHLVITCPDLWVFHNSFFFAGVVGTTIGYGDVYPATTAGKIFCMFYALTSVPFFNFLLGNISRSIHLYLFYKNGGNLSEMEKGRLIALYAIFGLVVTMFIPALFFMFLEQRTFLDAIYFVVISLTTVGFGDITPSFKDSSFFVVYRFIVLFWIFFGLSFIAGLAPLVRKVFRNFTRGQNFCAKVACCRTNKSKQKLEHQGYPNHQIPFRSLLSDFEDELKRRAAEKDVNVTAKSNIQSLKGCLYIYSPHLTERQRANVRFLRSLEFIDDTSRSRHENIEEQNYENQHTKTISIFKDL